MAKKLLILDLDETLIHATDDYQLEGDYDFKFELGGTKWSWEQKTVYFVMKRPFLDEFLKYAFQNFNVAIWTAGGIDYARKIIEGIGITESSLEFFYTRNNCTIKVDYASGMYYGEKRLSKVSKSMGWDLEEMLIVDDVPETAVHNYGNLIRIRGFYGDNSDTELLKLSNYLEKIKDEVNFRRIEKRGWSN